MIYKNKILLFTMLLPAIAFCQQAADTAAIIKTYSKVMAFTNEPYLHYTSLTKLAASPILQSEDTLSSQGDYYKKNTEMYMYSTTDEMYVQDSLMVQISHIRKTIWVSKIAATGKEQPITAPSGTGVKDIQQLLQKKYIINQKDINKNTSSISFESHLKDDTSSKPYNAIVLYYDPVNNLPKSMLIVATMQQPATEEAILSLKDQEIDSSKLLKDINGLKYLVRTQQMEVVFSTIETGKDKVIAMPTYAACIAYNKASSEYEAIGKYKNYEVTKLF